MAVLTVNNPTLESATVIQKSDLNSAPHAFTFSTDRQFLVIENNEAVSLTVNIVGDGVLTFNCPTYGDIDVSGGQDFIVNSTNTVTVYIRLNGAFLGSAGNNVTLSVTGSTGTGLAYAWIEEF